MQDDINTPLEYFKSKTNEPLLRTLMERGMRLAKSDPNITGHELTLEPDLKIFSHSALGEFDSSNGLQRVIVDSGAFLGRDGVPLKEHEVSVLVSTAPREGYEDPHMATVLVKDGTRFDPAIAEQHLSAQGVNVKEIAGYTAGRPTHSLAG